MREAVQDSGKGDNSTVGNLSAAQVTAARQEQKVRFMDKIKSNLLKKDEPFKISKNLGTGTGVTGGVKDGDVDMDSPACQGPSMSSVADPMESGNSMSVSASLNQRNLSLNQQQSSSSTNISTSNLINLNNYNKSTSTSLSNPTNPVIPVLPKVPGLGNLSLTPEQYQAYSMGVQLRAHLEKIKAVQQAQMVERSKNPPKPGSTAPSSLRASVYPSAGTSDISSVGPSSTFIGGSGDKPKILPVKAKPTAKHATLSDALKQLNPKTSDQAPKIVQSLRPESGTSDLAVSNLNQAVPAAAGPGVGPKAAVTVGPPSASSSLSDSDAAASKPNPFRSLSNLSLRAPTRGPHVARDKLKAALSSPSKVPCQCPADERVLAQLEEFTS